MRLVADEGCDFRVVRALRAANHDVLSILESFRGAEDPAVIEIAVREERVLLTEDKDFGQLVYANGAPSSGVILIRFPNQARSALPQAVVDLVNQEGERLFGAFVVLQPGRMRISRGPTI